MPCPFVELAPSQGSTGISDDFSRPDQPATVLKESGNLTVFAQDSKHRANLMRVRTTELGNKQERMLSRSHEPFR